MYQPRDYRYWIKDDDLVSFNVTVKETDLYIRAASNLEAEALEAVIKHRTSLEEYSKRHPSFLHTLEPCSVEEDAPAIVGVMARAAQIAGVGPMAAVAGAIAEAVGKDLLVCTPEVVVENGGDIFMKISRTRLIGVYARGSSFTGKIALEISPEETPLGVCTSSGTVGHSFSMGHADAVCVISKNGALADAVATATGNRVISKSDIQKAIEYSSKINGVDGLVVIMDEKIGLWGNVEVVPIHGSR